MSKQIKCLDQKIKSLDQKKPLTKLDYKIGEKYGSTFSSSFEAP